MDNSKIKEYTKVLKDIQKLMSDVDASDEMTNEEKVAAIEELKTTIHRVGNMLVFMTATK
jgi:hypothetical protein